MIDDKIIQQRLIEIFEKQPELNDPKKVIQMVWRYWEVCENDARPLSYLMRTQWERWQYRWGTVESIVRSARKLRDAGQNQLSLKHYESYHNTKTKGLPTLRRR